MCNDELQVSGDQEKVLAVYHLTKEAAGKHFKGLRSVTECCLDTYISDINVVNSSGKPG